MLVIDFPKVMKSLFNQVRWQTVISLQDKLQPINGKD